MSELNNITFDENKYKIKSRSILGQSEVPGITKLLLKKGIVKDEKSANNIMLTVIVLFLLSSIWVFAFFVFDLKITGPKSEDPNAVAQREALKERALQLRNNRINNTNNSTQ